jgi:hypothetical protein
MQKTVKTMGFLVIALAVVALIVGGVFIAQGFAKQDIIVGAMKAENISMGAFGGDPKNTIDTIDEAQKAADTVREHRHSIAPTYGDLLGGKKYDPTNPVQLTYAQAMNLENYLYLGVASMGLVQVVLGSGAFMVLAAVTFGAVGATLVIISSKL